MFLPSKKKSCDHFNPSISNLFMNISVVFKLVNKSSKVNGVKCL